MARATSSGTSLAERTGRLGRAVDGDAPSVAGVQGDGVAVPATSR